MKRSITVQPMRVRQFCPSCGQVELVTKMLANVDGQYVAWCPCGAVFNNTDILVVDNFTKK